ncbi:hypothetical protein EA462_01145 [Natrarchaeobius halalkaliphilus]|uniref:DUF7847 domain-containing protein n=1 Tax=Natrarchaeobius halalkaliphilus TaxID=1679091 RepID=A0A3N6P4I1_9EURY|nr:hypothetical protein [Natrarchaeobius halalkaliphilus]RQG92859.1 hypothetical protein EA462_01145 [Natrarchaeobius halalkaliphilus]
MVVIRSLKRTPGLLRSEPIIFVPILVIGLLQAPQLFAQSLDPVVSTVVSLVMTGLFVFVMPFFFGGLIGMVNDVATSGRTSLGRFIGHGKTFYLSILGAYLIVFALTMTLGFALGIGVVVGVIGLFASGGSALAIAVVVLLLLVFLVIYLAIIAVFQFYGHAVVLDGARAVDSLKRSFDVVRTNLRQVVGYYLVLIVGGVVIGGIYGAMMLLLFPPATPGEPAPMPDLGPALVGVGGSALLTTLFGAVFLVYSVVFYRAITGLDEPTTESSEPSAL